MIQILIETAIPIFNSYYSSLFPFQSESYWQIWGQFVYDSRLFYHLLVALLNRFYLKESPVFHHEEGLKDVLNGQDNPSNYKFPQKKLQLGNV